MRWSVHRDEPCMGEIPAGAFHSGCLEAKAAGKDLNLLHVFSWSPPDFVQHVSKTQKRPSGVLKGKIMGTEGGRIVPALLYAVDSYLPLIWGPDIEGWAIMNSGRFSSFFFKPECILLLSFA